MWRAYSRFRRMRGLGSDAQSIARSQTSSKAMPGASARLLLNLAGNAIKFYFPGRGGVYARDQSARECDPGTRGGLRSAHTGIGIPPIVCSPCFAPISSTTTIDGARRRGPVSISATPVHRGANKDCTRWRECRCRCRALRNAPVSLGRTLEHFDLERDLALGSKLNRITGEVQENLADAPGIAFDEVLGAADRFGRSLPGPSHAPESRVSAPHPQTYRANPHRVLRVRACPLRTLEKSKMS